VAVSGCQVSTRVAVDETASGRGVVAVTVTLDASALSAVGGQAALAAQLQDADLRTAGWSVTGPVAGPRGTAVISASHPFADPAQASALVGEIAGTGPDSSRPFRLVLTDHRTFWRTDRTLSGTVDLTCGLACFGDSGLTRSVGSPTGVAPGPLSSGGPPGQVFTFAVAARLPGSMVTTNGSSQLDGTVQWNPRLGQVLQLSAVSRAWNGTRIGAVSVAAGAVALTALGLLAFRWRRRRRRRRGAGTGQTGTAGHRRGGGAHRQSRRRVADSVAPRS
jgi:hypothetical protein